MRKFRDIFHLLFQEQFPASIVRYLLTALTTISSDVNVPRTVADELDLIFVVIIDVCDLFCITA